jgi:hypothetical protein
VPVPPPWQDKAATAKLVAEKIQEIDDEEAREFHTYYMPQMANLVVRWSKPTKERKALVTSERGDLSVLIDMINSEKVFSPAIRNRINEFLTQKRSLRTGRIRGAQKKDEYTRRALNPIHNAADEVPLIKDILKELYPKQSTSRIRERALWIAVQRHGGRVTTLAKHLDRPKKDPRRV